MCYISMNYLFIYISLKFKDSLCKCLLHLTQCGIDGTWLWGVGLVVVRFHPVITVCYQIWGKSDVSPVLGKCPRWWRMMWSAGRGATDRPNLVIWLSNCINFWIQSSPLSCHRPGSVPVIFSWILKSFPQFHSEHSWDHKENIHCLRPWFRLVLYIIVPSFIQITAKHSPRSQDCKDLPALKINLSASQLFQVQISVISVVTALTRRPRKLFRIDS